MHGINHPINDPSLVSYHRPELVAMLPQLELAYDCWTLLNGVERGSRKEAYLQREPAEPSAAYKARLNRATYAPIYRDSIRSYAGLLGRFNLIDVPTSLDDNKHDVDLQGSSIQSFLTSVDEMVLRDGGAYIMTDMMPDSSADNFFDQSNDGRHPYFIQVRRSDVVNWSVSYKRGIESLEHATIRMLRSVSDSEGAFGNKIEPVYYYLTPGKVQIYRVVKSGPSRWENLLVEEINTSMPVIPLTWYGATSSRFGQGDMPLTGLAELSIQHFQMRSDLCELLHKCAMPVPVRKGAMVGPDGRPAPLVLGPNTAVDLPAEGGDFKFSEPSGQSLDRHQTEIKHIEELMDRSSLNFLYGVDVKTATEASLRSSQVASSVSAMIRNKTSAVNALIRFWAWYAGEQSQVGAETGIAINDSLINKPLEANEMAQLVNLYTNELLSRKTVLDELQRGGVLDPDMMIDDEIARIEEDHAAKQEQMMADNEQKLEQDLHRAEEFQKVAPSEPGQGSDEEPKGRDPKTEQEKTAQAAKVAK